jgi:hypothetical protein
LFVLVIYGARLKWSYVECVSRDVFIFLVIKIYGCFHSHFDYLFIYLWCSSHYSTSSQSSLVLVVLIIRACVHSPPTFTCYCDFSTCCHAQEAFLISSTHLTQCTSIFSQFVTNNTFLVYGLWFY